MRGFTGAGSSASWKCRLTRGEERRGARVSAVRLPKPGLGERTPALAQGLAGPLFAIRIGPGNLLPAQRNGITGAVNTRAAGLQFRLRYPMDRIAEEHWVGR